MCIVVVVVFGNFLPRTGTSRDILGTVLANMSKNTVNASRTEMPALIFSPVKKRSEVNEQRRN